ncbi:MAG: ABC transporter permease, partial [Clostridia bacterium]|nr:ABC transporter permease [Clostridia bacterium]
MKTSVFKLTVRSVRSFAGRYIALALIIFLSVGFFAGLRISTDAMLNTCDAYLREQSFYDYRLISTLGYTKSELKFFTDLPFVKTAEGNKTVDALAVYGGSATESAIKILSLPGKLNRPSLVDGRLPENENECVADAERFGKNDIGKTVKITEVKNNTLKVKEFTVTGIVDSPLYLNLDRGSAMIGSGSLSAFIYVNDSAFSTAIYTDIYITLKETAPSYSDKYNTLIDDNLPTVTDTAKKAARSRYDGILSEMGISEGMATGLGLAAPQVYVLTRNENVGYVSFESDSSILSGVSRILPIFFIMIAMLVCMTAMTRMIDEERSQIGVLKALGFSNADIAAKYLLYSGSATLIGWTAGFFLSTWLMPKLYWFVFDVLYGFTHIRYTFSLPLAIVTLAVSLVCVVGSTAVCCIRELKYPPADAIHPRPPRSGKRILLEKITFIWKRMSFLAKVSARNTFRYKLRLVMMIFGVGCCTALLITALGLRDSLINIGSIQFEGIQKYQLELTLNKSDTTLPSLTEKLNGIGDIDKYAVATKSTCDVIYGEKTHSVNFVSYDTSDLSGFWSFADQPGFDFPKKGEVLLCKRTANELGVGIGDTVTVRNSNVQTVELTVCGIFENYVYFYAFTGSDSIPAEWDKPTPTDKNAYAPNTVYVTLNPAPGGSMAECIDSVAKALLEHNGVLSVTRPSSLQSAVDNAITCINYITWVVAAFEI